MPFIGKHLRTNERIDITKYADPRDELDAGVIVCPLCEHPMYIRTGFIKRSHFVHYTVCQSSYGQHPETPEHLMGKMWIAEKMRAEFGDHILVRFEEPIEEINRIADVYMEFERGWRTAHECQLASITVEELKQRSDDYGKAGIDVVWWLGNKADTQANRAWCIERFGYMLTLSFHLSPS